MEVTSPSVGADQGRRVVPVDLATEETEIIHLPAGNDENESMHKAFLPYGSGDAKNPSGVFGGDPSHLFRGNAFEGADLARRMDHVGRFIAFPPPGWGARYGASVSISRRSRGDWRTTSCNWKALWKVTGTAMDR
jgi:hypothetical protein